MDISFQPNVPHRQNDTEFNDVYSVFLIYTEEFSVVFAVLLTFCSKEGTSLDSESGHIYLYDVSLYGVVGVYAFVYDRP